MSLFRLKIKNKKLNLLVSVYISHFFGQSCLKPKPTSRVKALNKSTTSLFWRKLHFTTLNYHPFSLYPLNFKKYQLTP